MTEQSGQLGEEINSWKGFPWALREKDRELWDDMIEGVREDFGEAVERSGKTFTVDPFFMALLLAQQKVIKQLVRELEAFGTKTSESNAGMATLLDF